MAFEGSKNGKETMGKDYLLFVDTNPVEGEHTWVLVGGQRSTSVSRKRDEIDVATKLTGGWGAKRAGMGSWSFDLEGIAVLDDAGADYLDDKFMEGEDASVMLWHESGKAYKGLASVTEFSIDTSHEDAATLKGTLNGIGKPIIEKNEPNPLQP